MKKHEVSNCIAALFAIVIMIFTIGLFIPGAKRPSDYIGGITG